MTFFIDDQVLRDLDIFSFNGSRSIFDSYNYTTTKGGQELLGDYLARPTNNLDIISFRIFCIDFFSETDFIFFSNYKEIEYIEYYLNLETNPLATGIVNLFVLTLKDRLKASNDIYIIKKGIKCIISLISSIQKLKKKFENKNSPTILKNLFKQVDLILSDSYFEKIFSNYSESRHLNKVDNYLRIEKINYVIDLLKIIYEIDVYHALKIFKQKNKSCLVLPKKNKVSNLDLVGIYHPLVDNPVQNNIELNAYNTTLITGSNMAGKSTFIKTIGLCVYLAHCGFPVPAYSMNCSLYNGIVSGIQITDNTTKGISFYASEINRLDIAAENIKTKGYILVILDELLKGTNIKDAQQGLHEITMLFSKIKNSTFVITTHLTEVAEQLKESSLQISFNYFETNKVINEFDFKIKKGISCERLGYYLLEKRGIIDKLKSCT